LSLKYIKYHYNNVFFLPKNIPEEIIWNDDILSKSDLNDGYKENIRNVKDFKLKFNLFASYSFGDDSATGQKSAYQYFLKRWCDTKNSDYNEIVSLISDIKSKAFG
jgi:hypothetical protein